MQGQVTIKSNELLKVHAQSSICMPYPCIISAGTFVSQHGPGCTLCQQFELALPILLPCITSRTSRYGEADTIPISWCACACMDMAWYQLILQPLCGCYISAASVHIAEGGAPYSMTERACTPHPSHQIPSREVQVTAGDTAGIPISSKAAEFEV